MLVNVHVGIISLTRAAVIPSSHFLVVAFYFLSIFQGYCAQRNGLVGVKGNAIQGSPLKARLTTRLDWIKESLEIHNFFRALHGSSPLVLNNTLSEISQYYANHLLEVNLRQMEAHRTAHERADIYFEHNPATSPAGIGENLFYSQMTTLFEPIPSSYAVVLWYEEIKDYDFSTAKRKPTSDPKAFIGHLTQLLWNSTNQMGTAYASKKLANNETLVFVVANYYKAGNMIVSGNREKLYFQNVFPSSLSEADTNAKIVSRNVQSWWLELAPKTVSSKSWRNSALEIHNQYRSMHGAQPLRLNDDLCKVSQLWVNYLLEKGIQTFNHYGSVDTVKPNFKGVNICNLGESSMYFLTGKNNVRASLDNVVKLWYDQGKQYDFKRWQQKSNSKSTFGFEQLVWNSSTEFCISYAEGKTDNGQYFLYVTANYYPSFTRRIEDKQQNVFPTSGGTRNFTKLPAATANTAMVEVTTILLFYLFSLFVII